MLRCLPHFPATHTLTRVFGKGEDSYIYCTRCGQRWQYSLTAMRIGPRIDRAPEVRVPEGAEVARHV